MRVGPQRDVLAFENRLKIQREYRITEHSAGDIQVLNIVEVERLTDKWQMNSERQDNQDNQEYQIARGPLRKQALLSGLHTIARLRRLAAEMNRGSETVRDDSRRSHSI